MDQVDLAIGNADAFLSRRRNPRAAFVSYLHAIRLIVDHMMEATTFEVGPAGDAGKMEADGTAEFKNHVVVKPADAERLFGLAHLCFTEVEDIVNGDVSTEDLEDDEEDDDEDVKDDTEDENEIRRLLDLMKPLGVQTVPLDSHPYSTVASSPSPPPPPPKFRTKKLFLQWNQWSQHQVRNSVRMSLLALGLDNPTFKPSEELRKSDSRDGSRISESPNFQNRISILAATSNTPLIPPRSSSSTSIASKSSKPISDIIDQYRPLIPPSPLSTLHSRLTSDYNTSVNELRLLNSRETINAKDAQSTLSTTILDFSPRSIAVNLTLLDWNLLQGVSEQDVSEVVKKDTTPLGVRCVLDLSLFVSRLVVATVLREMLVQTRGKILSHWMDVLEELMGLYDFQSMDAILHGLGVVAGLERSWVGVGRRSRGKLEDARDLLGSKDGYRWYRLALARAVSPVVPCLRVLVEDVVLGRMEVGVLEMYKSAGETGYAVEAKERNDVVLHWMLTQKWMTAGDVEKLSNDIEEPLSQGMKLLGKLRGREVKGAVEESGEGWVVTVTDFAEMVKSGRVAVSNVQPPMLMAVVAPISSDDLPEVPSSSIFPPPSQISTPKSHSRSASNLISNPQPSNNSSGFPRVEQTILPPHLSSDELQSLVEQYLSGSEVEIPVLQSKPSHGNVEPDLSEIRMRIERLKESLWQRELETLNAYNLF
ncbi:hypothetical protein BC829DRAFT_443905 [Chytridium lagenaria]|nr:hypothetical protein BC829DRAFT_443905 [Chytridium lagenaria]